MASSSPEGSLDLCQIVTDNAVESLRSALLYGGRRFLVWTRLSVENSSWIINVSDGVDVWRLELDKEQLESYKELVEIEKNETYFTRFRSEFLCGHLTIAQLANKVVLNVGATLTFDLYEARANDKKVEIQGLIFRMADDITELTQKLKVSEESLEELKNQTDASHVGPSIFDLPQKKAQAPTVKRKPGNSLINPGSRNDDLPPEEPSDLETVHISVLGGSQMLDVFRCPNPMQCPSPCNRSSRRYHCPLCDNRPQKPGRMRRHFFTMHAGKHVIEHEGYRILRCKLKCIRSNGRITDCSHYHCCLCGRVCLRKVHLCCHLQAHALGTAKGVDDDVMGVSKAEEENDEEEVDDEDDCEVDTADESAVEAAEISHISCSVADDEQTESIVALAEGAQVVYVQSTNGETLTVVPVSRHAETLQVSQSQQLTSVGSNAAHLASGLQVLTSSDTGNPITGLEDITQVPQEMGNQDASVIVKHVEVILDQGDGGVPVSQESTVGSETTVTTTEMAHIQQYTEQHNEPNKVSDPIQYEHTYNDFHASQRDPALVTAAVVLGQTASQVISEELSNQEQSMKIERLSSVTTTLDVTCNQLVTSTPVATSQMPIRVVSDVPLLSTPIRTDVVMTPESSSPFQGHFFPETAQDSAQSPRRHRASENDALRLLEKVETPREDDHVFSKLFMHSKPRVENIIQHPSVVQEQAEINVCRCKNTECDCRLYHCPLCTCLPNKPGRIREHFKKIHSEDLIIRYQGHQMLRCKLGCCRPSGKRILNSHYHCCLCGCICISKSGVYEHIRTQHSSDSTKTEADVSTPRMQSNKRKAPPTKTPAKKRAEVTDSVTSKAREQQPFTSPQLQRPLVLQIPSLGAQVSGGQKLTGSDEQTGGTGNQQTIAIQLPQTGDVQPQQPLVILMPQQYQTLGQGQGQGQQPIVIVMPQGGSGQPIVIPMPQTSTS